MPPSGTCSARRPRPKQHSTNTSPGTAARRAPSADAVVGLRKAQAEHLTLAAPRWARANDPDFPDSVDKRGADSSTEPATSTAGVEPYPLRDRTRAGAPGRPDPTSDPYGTSRLDMDKRLEVAPLAVPRAHTPSDASACEPGSWHKLPD